MPKIITIDIETESPTEYGALQPYRDDFSIMSFGIGTARRQKAVRHPSIREINNTLHSIIKQNAYVGGWNLVFDFGVMIAQGVDEDLLWKLKIVDGWLLWLRTDWMYKAYEKEMFKERNPELSYGLKQYVREHWPEHAGYEELGYDSLKYLKYDVKFTSQAITNELKRLPKYERSSFLEECRNIMPLAQSWVRGIIVDTDALDHLNTVMLKERDTHAKAAGLTMKQINSPPQLRKILFDERGFTPGKKTDTGAWSTDKSVLLELALDSEFAGHVQKAKAAGTTLSKFYKGVKESLEYNGTGKVYPSPRPAGTYTGRFTYSSKTIKAPTGVALHQWQAKPEVRALLIPPPGYWLLEVDAAGQEMRLMADASGDPVMIDAFQKGKDAHSLTASQLSGFGYNEIVAHKDGKHKLVRKAGKLCNLSLQYRTSAKTFRERAFVNYGMRMTLPEAQGNQRSYHGLYQYVKVYWESAKASAKKKGYAITQGGRKVRLENYTSKRKWRLESTAINFPIQGTGADMRHAALDELRTMMSTGLLQLAWDLHDGLFFYVKKDYAAAIALDVRRRLNDIDYQKRWGWQPTVPLTWDVSIGPSWDKLKELK